MTQKRIRDYGIMPGRIKTGKRNKITDVPGVLSGFLLSFTMSLDDFIITHFTKGAGINTLSTLIYSEVRRGIKPSMYALSTVIFLTVLILLLIVNFRSFKKKD